MSQHSLKCYYCNHIWTPRVPDPKSCPRCKRAFNKTKGRVPQRVEKQEKQEYLVDLPEVEIIEHEGPVYEYCSVCAKLDDDVEAPYKWMGKPYCLLHFLEQIIEFDQTYNYKKKDAFEELDIYRKGMREIISEVLSGLRPSALDEDPRWEDITPV